MNVFIGIDPDVCKSGVAYYVRETKLLELSNLTFFQLYDYLKFALENKENHNLTVIVDAGWLNKSNWHSSNKFTKNVNATIGEKTGANHEVGKKIVEMCKYLGIETKLNKPTKTKVNHEYFKKITGIIGKTNQEQRDAAMLVFGK